jgi:hypothetical protein
MRYRIEWWSSTMNNHLVEHDPHSELSGGSIVLTARPGEFVLRSRTLKLSCNYEHVLAELAEALGDSGTLRLCEVSTRGSPHGEKKAPLDRSNLGKGCSVRRVLQAQLTFRTGTTSYRNSSSLYFSRELSMSSTEICGRPRRLVYLLPRFIVGRRRSAHLNKRGGVERYVS